MFKRKRVGKFTDPAIEELEARRGKKKIEPRAGTTWSGSGSIDGAAGQAVCRSTACDVSRLATAQRTIVVQSRAIFAGLSDVGRRRTNNEDAFCVGADFAGVFDGLGGAPAGEVASRIAACRVVELLSSCRELPSPRDAGRRLRAAVEAANLEVFRRGELDSGCRGMATTATVAAFVGKHLFVAQVGDSRAYLLRRGQIVQVTEDQTVAAALVKIGKLTREEARSVASMLAQAIGIGASVDVTLSYVELRRGDVLLLCSDGLTDMLRDEQIREALLAHPEPADATAALVAAALLAGGSDNVTVVAGRFDDPGLPEPTEQDLTFLQQYSPIGVQV